MFLLYGGLTTYIIVFSFLKCYTIIHCIFLYSWMPSPRGALRQKDLPYTWWLFPRSNCPLNSWLRYKGVPPPLSEFGITVKSCPHVRAPHGLTEGFTVTLWQRTSPSQEQSLINFLWEMHDSESVCWGTPSPGYALLLKSCSLLKSVPLCGHTPIYLPINH